MSRGHAATPLPCRVGDRDNARARAGPPHARRQVADPRAVVGHDDGLLPARAMAFGPCSRQAQWTGRHDGNPVPRRRWIVVDGRRRHCASLYGGDTGRWEAVQGHQRVQRILSCRPGEQGGHADVGTLRIDLLMGGLVSFTGPAWLRHAAPVRRLTSCGRARAETWTPACDDGNALRRMMSMMRFVAAADRPSTADKLPCIPVARGVVKGQPVVAEVIIELPPSVAEHVRSWMESNL